MVRVDAEQWARQPSLETPLEPSYDERMFTSMDHDNRPI